MASQAPPNTMQKLLTVQEAAMFLNTSTTTVYRYAKQNVLPHIRLPLGLRFRPQDLMEWIDQGRREDRLSKRIISQTLTFSPPGYIKDTGGKTNMANPKKGRQNYGYGACYIRKTKRGYLRFYIDYYDRNGERIQQLIKTATSWQEANSALKNAVLQEHLIKCGDQEQPTRIKFKALCDLYLENYAKINKKSWKDDQYRIDAHMKPYFGEYELKNINPMHIEKYRAQRLESDVSKSTVNREITILKKMFNLAIDWNLAGHNPVLRVKLFSEKDTQKERILTDEEELRLLSESPPYLKPILVAALNTGMRRGEIFRLEWQENVDFRQRIIKVTNTKSGKNRIIPINDLLLQELILQKKTSGKNGFVFPNPVTKKPFVDIKKSFKHACNKAGIDNLRFHDLRHTFASRLVKAGVDLITVRDLLGHFSVRVTQRYTHSCQDQKVRAVELLVQYATKKLENGEEQLHPRYIN